MFKNYLKIAFRSTLKYKGYSFINVVGLSFGMACSVLILLWVQDELSFDRFHQNADSLYRVEENQHYSGEVYHVNVTPYPSAPVWKQEVPEILDATRYSWGFGLLIRYGEKAFFENPIRAVDPSFFQMFRFPFIQGDKSTALERPYSMVITEEMAKKYFDGEDPIGKILSANNRYDFVVTGVVDNPPPNSTLQFQMLVPFEFTREMGWYNESWGSNSIQTFVQLRPNSSIPAVNETLTKIVKTHNERSTTDFLLAPFTGLHLYAYFGYGRPMGDIQYVYIFSIVAVFVLLLACINFMNLSTARSASRAKEIGMRKVSGAFRQNIAGQFLGESVLIALCSLLLAIGLVIFALPVFNNLSGKEITAAILLQPNTLLGLVGVTLFTGLVAGSYPAFFLSSFEPVGVLKGSLKSGAKSSLLRKVLVVTQFALSVFLIIGTGIVYKQLQFMKTKGLGYDKEHLLYISMRGDIDQSYEALKGELLNRPEILGVTASGSPPASIGSNSSGAIWQGKDPDQKVLISHTRVDYDYVETLGIEMVDGRSFSRDYASDAGTDSTGAFLVNEELATIMGLNPVVGADLSFMGQQGTIIGVMKDFHYQSVRVPIEPLALGMAPPENLSFMAIRIRPADISSSIDVIRSIWNRVIPNYPFEFRFVDEDLDRRYRAEERMGGVLRYFAILAVIISCLGLLALASFMAEQRTKEIGIRKVLGASIPTIVGLLSKEFAKWVIIANMIAWPVAYFTMSTWLAKFAHRIETSWTTFLMAGSLALLIALLTVGWQAVKSALANPAKALRYE
jgi:ABC-type antimicrobial peptide transport system permease subunit